MAKTAKTKTATPAPVPQTPPPTYTPQAFIEVIGARAHNLQNLHVRIPRNKLVVVTGVSGSGKSSLAFDTIYAEGQRRFMETLSSYARQFIGEMERPDVDQIDGLSPVISIEQKTTGRSPRSTVGTVTEVYDFFRLLFARAGDAYSYASGKKMVKWTEDQIIDKLHEKFAGKKIGILAPLVRSRKGHYRELFEQMRKQGYTKMRVDGQLVDIEPGMMLDRYKIHDIELLIDRVQVEAGRRDRMVDSVRLAMKQGDGLMQVLDLESDQLFNYSRHLMCEDTGLSYDEPSPNTFSFNSPYGMCPHCRGLGEVFEVDMKLVIPDDTKSINDVGIVPFGEVRENYNFKILRDISKKYKFTFSTPIKEIPAEAMQIIMHGSEDGKVDTAEEATDQQEWQYNIAKEGLVGQLKRWYEESTSEKIRQFAEDFMVLNLCDSCKGTRLKQESQWFKIADKSISEMSAMDLNELYIYFQDIETRMTDRQVLIAKDVLKEIRFRLRFLLQVGLNYLNLNRSARTLSGGESQRIRLATQIGSQLTGITYILDEPSIGLHQRDNHRLIKALKNLRDIGNTILVVEHDKDIMIESDYLIDLGPGAGRHGGRIVDEGTPAEFMAKPSVTSDYLSGRRSIPVPKVRRKGSGKQLVLKGAKGNNLKNVNLTIPLGTLIVVTGVSGSGKSTLINETLYPILQSELHNSLKRPLAYDSFEGMEHVDKVIEIDQSPIGRSPRSNPATYTNVFSDIRKLFSETPEAKIRGYKPGRFSFNVKGGRCEVCEGGGMKVIEMNFLPDVSVPCDRCMGRRYNRETREVLYKGKSISDVLDMTIDDATVFFSAIPTIHRRIDTLKSVGLGYVSLGQSATTLSGGEAQRVKLAEELSKRDTGQTIYIMDEPTTGLHFEDIQKLLEVIQQLVEKGNTVVIIEHNMDVIKVADHIIDVGPEGGAGGGKIVCVGTPEQVVKCKESWTGKYLEAELKPAK
jgi:excinuclease ABC subunit A